MNKYSEILICIIQVMYALTIKESNERALIMLIHQPCIDFSFHSPMFVSNLSGFLRYDGAVHVVNIHCCIKRTL